MLQPFKRTKVYEVIVDQILAMFRNGELKPGDRMPSERELATSMAVSRTSIREAFRALESMGYIETRVGDGTFVRMFSLETLVQPVSVGLLQNDRRLVEEFIEVRQTLEIQGVKLAAARMTAAQADELDAILADMERDIAAGGTGHEQDREFHLRLSDFTGNASLCTMFEACRGMLDKTSNMIMQIREQPRRALEGHRRIVSHLRRGDGEGAAKAMNEHLEQIYGYLDQLHM